MKRARIIYNPTSGREAFKKHLPEVLEKLEKAGFRFKEHGGNHDTYKRGNDTEQVPRHREINEITAKMILKKWRLL